MNTALAAVRANHSQEYHKRVAAEGVSHVEANAGPKIASLAEGADQSGDDQPKTAKAAECARENDGGVREPMRIGYHDQLVKDGDDSACPICHDPLASDDHTALKNCSHRFHRKCFCRHLETEMRRKGEEVSKESSTPVDPSLIGSVVVDDSQEEATAASGAPPSGKSPTSVESPASGSENGTGKRRGGGVGSNSNAGKAFKIFGSGRRRHPRIVMTSLNALTIAKG